LPVSVNARNIVFTVVLLAVVGAVIFEARVWEIKARLFPWAIGIPVLAMIVALLMKQILEQFNRSRQAVGEVHSTDSFLGDSRAGASHSAEVHPAERHAAEVQAQVRRRAYSIVGWLLGFLAAIWMLGFPAGGTLGTLAYLKLAAGEGWPISVAISAGTAVFFWLMINFLNTPFPRGTLFDLVAPGA
jgi:hypothetical protein